MRGGEENVKIGMWFYKLIKTRGWICKKEHKYYSRRIWA